MTIEEILIRFVAQYIDRETIHLCTYDEYSKLQSQLYRILINHNVDLSFKELYLPYFDMTIGGNAQGISSEFLRKLIKQNWQKVDIEDLENIKINHVYTCDKYGFVVLKNTNEPITVVKDRKQIGIGSMAAINVTNTDLYIDKFNNIKIDTYTIVYD